MYFVTFHLADSLSVQVLAELKSELAAGERGLREIARDRARRLERWLDAGRGSCVLARPGAADCMARALRHFDGNRYRLFAWCVMPNHAHVVLSLAEGVGLGQVVLSWKSFTARRINALIGRRGTLWQREYFDRIIRDGDHLARAIRYVLNNPAKAGLKDWSWVWVREDLREI